MKPFNFGIAALALALAAATPASARVVATLDLSRSGISLKDMPSNAFDYDATTFAGALAAYLSKRVGVQVDARYSRLKNDLQMEQEFGSATVHAFYRTPVWRAGLYGGGEYTGETFWLAGLEGQYFFPRVTAFGSVGFGEGERNGRASNLRLGARAFLTDNFSFEVAADRTRFQFQTISSVDAAAEWRPFAYAPFSVYAGYREHDNNRNAPVGDTSAAEIGVRFTFGARSLIDRDRHGPSFTRGAFVSRALE